MKILSVTRIVVSGLLLLIALGFGVFWLPQSNLATDFARNHPVWAWHHGSPEMQRSAAKMLQKRITVGTPIQDVIELLGPGAAGWPEKYEGTFRGDGIVGFNVRSWYNNGLDVGYRDGKVVCVSYFD